MLVDSSHPVGAALHFTKSGMIYIHDDHLSWWHEGSRFASYVGREPVNGIVVILGEVDALQD